MKHSRILFARLLAVLVGLMGTASPVRAADEDLDTYKLKLTGLWFYSRPSGTLQGSNDSGTVDLSKDLGFNPYSTFTGKLDWKFTRKNHFYFVAGPFDSSRQTALSRTFVFQGQTFVAGLTTHSELKSNLYAPGYQYDIIRRRRGHLGIAAQLNLLDSKASISATGQLSGNSVQQGTVSASGSLFAPIPVLGPDFRFYFAPRFYVQGNVYGMYFFGYGNFISSSDMLGVRLAKHVSLNAGYQLGSRLVVNNKNSSDRIGLHFTQEGPVFGFEFF
jgi:hypothetical protein